MHAPRPAPTCAAASRASLAASPRAQIVLGACACAGTSLFIYAVDPSRHAVYPECPLYNATGIYCAGCGATRAVYALLHGRVLEALHDNALFVAALPLLLYLLASYVLKAWRGNDWPPVQVAPRTAAWRGGTVFLLMVAFMIVRNLPGTPWEWLRPL